METPGELGLEYRSLPRDQQALMSVDTQILADCTQVLAQHLLTICLWTEPVSSAVKWGCEANLRDIIGPIPDHHN